MPKSNNEATKKPELSAEELEKIRNNPFLNRLYKDTSASSWRINASLAKVVQETKEQTSSALSSVSKSNDLSKFYEEQNMKKEFPTMAEDDVNSKDLEDSLTFEESLDGWVDETTLLPEYNLDRGEEAYYNTGQNLGSSSQSDYFDLVEEQQPNQNQQVEQDQEQSYI